MADLQVEPKCPGCGRLTVDNRQHCADKTTANWKVYCRWMRCTKCKYTYGPVGWPGFAYTTGTISGGTP